MGRRIYIGSARAKLQKIAADMETYVREAIDEAYNQGKEDAAGEWEEWIKRYLTDGVKLACYPAQDYMIGSAHVITENQLQARLEEMDNGK